MFTQIFLSEIISIAENGGQGTHFLISQILKGLMHCALHNKLRGAIGKKKFFFFNWLAFTHFWSNFDEIFCAGVKP